MLISSYAIFIHCNNFHTKVALSGLRQILAIECPFKIDVVYFT